MSGVPSGALAGILLGALNSLGRAVGSTSGEAEHPDGLLMLAERARRALAEIRDEVTNLTILATEKVTRKTLDSADQRRLVEEALAELAFSALSATDN